MTDDAVGRELALYRARAELARATAAYLGDLDEAQDGQWAIIATAFRQGGVHRHVIMDTLGISWDTFQRWSSRRSAPGTIARGEIKAKMIEILNSIAEDLDAKTKHDEKSENSV